MPSSSPLIWNPLVSLRARGKTTNRRNCWSSYGRLPASHWGHVKLMWKIPQMGTHVRLRSRRLRIFSMSEILWLVRWFFDGFDVPLQDVKGFYEICSPGKSWPGTPSEWFQWFGRPTVDHAPFSDLVNMFFIIHGDSVHLLGYFPIHFRRKSWYVDAYQLTCSRLVATLYATGMFGLQVPLLKCLPRASWWFWWVKLVEKQVPSFLRRPFFRVVFAKFSGGTKFEVPPVELLKSGKVRLVWCWLPRSLLASGETSSIALVV